ncbi:ABC transporter permease [Veronia nyctiphanis]|uniref:ABC transporter permease n=1 Tax=Veronia nyctiphanis TaxID=1278244 RepID=A0A4Q0YU25_9GAMM|nr:FtsX-like permease family protein [Veronia nyctiphanis]RXJ74253.1 ABC transporter permease [Veronia nyctiphanis]
MFGTVAKALWGHYRRHPMQIILVLLGLTLGVALLVGVMSINEHAQQSYKRGERMFSNPFPYVLHPINRGDRISEDFYISLRLQGFKQCVPVDSIEVMTKEGRDMRLTGLDYIAFLNLDSFQKNGPRLFDLNRGNDTIWVSHELANHFSWQQGEYIQLINGQRIGPLELMSEDSLTSGIRLFTDISVLRKLSPHSGFSQIYCGKLSEEERQQIKHQAQNGVTLSRTESAELAPLTRAFHLNLLAMGLLAFVVGLFIFYQAISLSLTQRQPLVGTLRQLGVYRSVLAWVIIVEMALLLIVGLGLGNVIGVFLASKLLPTVATTLNDLYGANISLAMHWQWEWGAYSLLLALSGIGLASFWPSLRLLRTEPSRLAKSVYVVGSLFTEFKWQALLAFVLLCVTLVINVLPESLEQGFLLVGLTLLCGGLSLPFFMGKSFQFFARFTRSAKLTWFFSDASASLSFRGIAAMAFMMAIAVNIGMETMIGSFRHATESWLEKRLVADVYVRSEKAKMRELNLWMKSQPEIYKSWVTWKNELEYGDGAIEVVSLGTSIEERESLVLKDRQADFWTVFHTEKSLLISESLAQRLDVNVGSNIELPPPFGPGWQVSGIYLDYGNPRGQVMVSVRSKLIPWISNGSGDFAILFKEGIEPDEVIARMQKTFDLRDNQIKHQHDILERAMVIFDRTFSVTNTLSTLTLIIALCGLFFATLATEFSRQRQYALLRFLGISGRNLAFLGGGQLAVIGLFSALFALPLGLLISELLLNVVIKYSFGWTMSLTYFLSSYAITLVATIITLLAAGAWPVWRLIKRSAVSSMREAL